MTVDQSRSEQIARDDAHLESLGIQPQLNRRLGFIANFALAFSFISVSTGSFGNFGYGFGMGGPMMFWTWFVIIIGQTLVALVFAELASHFPVAGSIYQWSKRLSNRTLGWFTGWFYFWAQVVTVTAVAVIVAFAIDGLLGSPMVGDTEFLDSPDPTGLTTMFTFIALVALVLTTLINAFGVRLLAILNNIGVATEILGMLVFALILLFFANNQSTDVLFQTFGAEDANNGNMFATFLVGFYMSVFIVYGFDTAGTFGEETVDASRQAPKGVLSSIWISGAVGVVFLLAIILSIKDIPARMAGGLSGAEFPIATTILDNLNQTLVGDLTLGEVYLAVIADLGVRVHPGHPRRGLANDVLDEPGPTPSRWTDLGPRQRTIQDPCQRRRGRGRPGRQFPSCSSARWAGTTCRSPRRGSSTSATSCATSAWPSPAGRAGRTRRPGSTSAAGACRSTSWPSCGAAS